MPIPIDRLSEREMLIIEIEKLLNHILQVCNSDLIGKAYDLLKTETASTEYINSVVENVFKMSRDAESYAKELRDKVESLGTVPEYLKKDTDIRISYCLAVAASAALAGDKINIKMGNPTYEYTNLILSRNSVAKK